MTVTDVVLAIGIPAVWCLVLFLMFGMPYVLRVRQRRRTREQAERHGWRWDKVDHTLTTGWTLDPFSSARRRRPARQVVRGTHHGRSFVAFDYRKIVTPVSSGRGTFADYAVYAVVLPWQLPPMQAEPGDAERAQHIEAKRARTRASRRRRRDRALRAGSEFRVVPSGDARFDRRWTVRSTRPEFVRALFDDRMRATLRETDPFSWGIEGAMAVSVRSGVLSVEEIPRHVQALDTLLGGVPDTVWRTYAKQ